MGWIKNYGGGGALGRGRYGLAFENSFVRLSLPCAGSKAWQRRRDWFQSWGDLACLQFCLLPVCSPILSVCVSTLSLSSLSPPLLSPPSSSTSLSFTFSRLLSVLQTCMEWGDMLMPSNLEKIKIKFRANSEHEDFADDNLPEKRDWNTLRCMQAYV